MKTYLLIHGSWHRGIHFSTIVSQLKKLGHQVIANDLPGHNLTTTEEELKKICLNDYCQAVCQWVKTAQYPITIIAHSLGGLVATQALEYCADKVEEVIYVGAFVPQNGQAITDLLKHNKGSILQHVSIPTHDGTCSKLLEKHSREFYQGCNNDIAQTAFKNTVVEPNKPLKERVSLSNAIANTVTKKYILCEHDQIIIPTLQQTMYITDSKTNIRKIPTGHFPFLQDPIALLQQII